MKLKRLHTEQHIYCLLHHKTLPSQSWQDYFHSAKEKENVYCKICCTTLQKKPLLPRPSETVLKYFVHFANFLLMKEQSNLYICIYMLLCVCVCMCMIYVYITLKSVEFQGIVKLPHHYF